MSSRLIRKKQNTDDTEYDELIKRLDKRIEWINELQKKSEKEKLVKWVSIEKNKSILSGHISSNSDIEISYFSYVK